ncbi:ABC transporter permease [Candidatus Saccharibacteria bacterium]|nr:ABC transporter permease [Candidatus Saccharibacteria bacterium]
MSIPRILNQKNRILLKELTKTDFKLRYQGSVLGYLWALLRPLLMFVVLYIVFGHFLRFSDGTPHFSLYLLTGIVLWSFFTECTGQGIQAMVMRGDLIRKISFPKWVVVVSSSGTALINLGVNLVVVVVFALLNGIMPGLSWLLVPLSIIELFALSLGVSFLFGAINVKYRDISSIWDVLIQAMFYAVPIIYPLSMVMGISELAAKMLLLNPIAQVIQDVRYNLITDQTVTTWGLVGEGTFILKFVPIMIVVIILIWGAVYFRRKSKFFAEEV